MRSVTVHVPKEDALSLFRVPVEFILDPTTYKYMGDAPCPDTAESAREIVGDVIAGTCDAPDVVNIGDAQPFDPDEPVAALVDLATEREQREEEDK